MVWAMRGLKIGAIGAAGLVFGWVGILVLAAIAAVVVVGVMLLCEPDLADMV